GGGGGGRGGGNPTASVPSGFGGIDYGNPRLAGLNNIELITDRPLEVNLREIREVKKRYPKHALIASLMVETKEEWREIIQKAEDAGADGLGLNFGCPPGMCERGLGSGRRHRAQGAGGVGPPARSVPHAPGGRQRRP